MLEGRLGEFTLADILRLTALTEKSGRLWVVGGSVEGRVDVAAGRVRDASPNAARLQLARRLLGRDVVSHDTLAEALAEHRRLPTDLELNWQLRDHGAIDDELATEVAFEHVVDAVFELLRWREGTFRFEVGEPPVSKSGPGLALGIEELLEEVERRLAHLRELEERTGGLDAVVSLAPPEGQSSTVDLDRDAWALLSLVDGGRTVGELAELSGQGEYGTRRTLAALVDEGVVGTGPHARVPRGERLRQAFDALAVVEATLRGEAPARRAPQTAAAEEPGSERRVAEEPRPAPAAAEEPRPAPAAEEPRTATPESPAAERPEPRPSAQDVPPPPASEPRAEPRERPAPSVPPRPVAEEPWIVASPPRPEPAPPAQIDEAQTQEIPVAPEASPGEPWIAQAPQDVRAEAASAGAPAPEEPFDPADLATADPAGDHGPAGTDEGQSWLREEATHQAVAEAADWAEQQQSAPAEPPAPPAPTDAPDPATDEVAAAAPEAPSDGPAGQADVTPLRAVPSHERLRIEPAVDEDLVRRMIDGVESL